MTISRIASMHVVPSVSEGEGGPSYAVCRLCSALTAFGDDVVLHCLSAAGKGHDFATCTYRRWRFPARLGISPAMLRGLRRAVDRAQIVHNHGLWMMPNIYPAWATRGSGCRLITSPHGTLAPWAWSRSRLVKSVVWPLQKESLLRADCLHASAEREYRQIRGMGLRAPVAVIPFGIDIPAPRDLADAGEMKVLLFFGRIHPVKGVDLLLKVWSRIQGVKRDWRLRIVGPGDERYLRRIEALRKELSLRRVSVEGAAYGEEKYRVLRGADLYVLPTHTENFAFTVAEALACCVPSIVTTGAPWEGLTANGCGWWIDRDEETLRATLLEAMSLARRELREMGEKGRSWMEREYSWDEVGRKTHLTYEWVLGGGAAPSWVVER